MPGWKTNSCFRHATGVGIDVPVQYCLSSVGVRLVCFATQSRCAFGSSRKPKPCPHVVYMSSTCRLRREVKKNSLEQSTCRRAQDVEQQLQYQELISSNCPSWIQLALAVISRRAHGSIENHGKSPTLPGFFVGLCLPMVWLEQNLQMLSLAQVCEVVSH